MHTKVSYHGILAAVLEEGRSERNNDGRHIVQKRKRGWRREGVEVLARMYGKLEATICVRLY